MAKAKTTNTKKKVTKKTTVQKKRETTLLEYVAYALFALAMAYGFVSWAIDTGSLWLYLFCFISVYYSFYFIKQAVKKSMLTHENKQRKTTRSRRA